MNAIVAPPARGSMFALLLVQLFAACSPDATARDRTPPRSHAVARAPAVPAVDLGNPAYRVVALGAVGSVAGVVTRADSTTPPAVERIRDSLSVECGSRPATRGARRSAALVPNAVVWISGVPAGKPLREEKRAELESADCGLDPGSLAISVGTTVNVINDDRVLHRLVFTRDGSHDTVTSMPFFNEGEVVASERLGKTPGVIDVTCAFHPSTRARVAVFTHPYFTVTDDAGRFTIDSLPPGDYTLRVWPDGAARPTDQRITVAAGGTAKADVKVAGY